MTMKRERIYWICQITGWSAYYLINLILSLRLLESVAAFALISLVTTGIGMFLTHILRVFIHRRRWLDLSLGKLILRVVAASMTVAALMLLGSVFFKIQILRSGEWPEISAGYASVLWFNWSAVILLWLMIYFGVHFFQNYKRSEIEKLKLESSVKDAELRALKSQMNPHFLFNALNSIRALTSENSSKAQEAITRLANMLRYTLQAGAIQTVPLSAEIQMVSDYLAVESVRLEERLRVTILMDPKSETIHVPTMLIQTLVENAVKHGIAKLPEGGEIVLRSNVNNGTLNVQITNSGRLMPVSDSTKVGLANAAERLKLLFGNAATLTLQSKTPDTVTAEMTIPIVR